MRAGLTPPSVFLIVLTLAILLAIGLAFWLGLLDRLTNAILRRLDRGQASTNFAVKEVCHQSDDYAVLRLSVAEKASIAGLRLKDAGLQERDITVLAIERGSSILSHPQPEEKLLAGDCLLRYAKLAEIETPDRGETNQKPHKPVAPAPCQIYGKANPKLRHFHSPREGQRPSR